ncbi:MAG TPA: hypothetical protein V6C88_10640 [Chroococcidiopsis sp.]
MSQATQPKTALSKPKRSRLYLWLWVSLGLHGLVVFLPWMPSNTPPPKPPTEELSLIELTPTVAPPPPPLPTTLPTVVTPKPTPSPPLASPSPVANPQPSTVPASPSPTPAATPTPTASPTPTATPSPTPSPTATPISTPTPTPPPLPYANFPQAPNAVQFADAVAGCDRSSECWRTPNTQWRTVAQDLRSTLESENYSLQEIDLGMTGGRLYEVSKDGQIEYYVAFVSTPNGTVYALTQEQPSCTQLYELAGVSSTSSPSCG